MEELKKWALGVCTAAIFSSVIYALVPKGNMQKIMRCVTALAVICALIFPLASAIMKTNFSASSPDTEALIPSELNNEVNYRLTAAYAQQMQDGVQEILASYGYPDCEIDLLTDIDEYGGIFSINQMIISKNPQFTGISARQQLEFTTHLLLTD